MSTKLKVFCSLPVFLEQEDKDLYYAIRAMCALGQLVPKGGVKGITFLYPQDAAYRKEIISAAFSENQEKAYQMIQSLIIPMYIPTIGEFNKYKDDIPNKLGNRIEIGTGAGVSLIGGGVLTPYSKFKAAKGKNIAVYNLKGKIPVDGKKSTNKYVGKDLSKSARGGGHTDSPSSLQRHDVQDRFTCLLEGRSKNVMAERVVSYMLWDAKNNPASYYGPGGCFEALTGIPDVDYFTVLRITYSKFPNDQVGAWLSATKGCYVSKDGVNVYNDYQKLYNAQANEYWTQKGVDEDQAHIDLVQQRSNMLETGLSRPALRSSLGEVYSSDPTKAWLDDMRFIGCYLYKDVLDAPRGPAQASAFKDYVFSMTHIYAPTGSIDDTTVLGKHQLLERDPCLHISTTIKFVRSNASLWAPISDTSLNLPQFGGPYRTVSADELADSPFNWFAAVHEIIANQSAIPSLSQVAYDAMSGLLA